MGVLSGPIAGLQTISHSCQATGPGAVAGKHSWSLRALIGGLAYLVVCGRLVLAAVFEDLLHH
jgi:hypothetical protein